MNEGYGPDNHTVRRESMGLRPQGLLNSRLVPLNWRAGADRSRPFYLSPSISAQRLPLVVTCQIAGLTAQETERGGRE